jgi:SAM-dependent methyltransferase
MEPMSVPANPYDVVASYYDEFYQAPDDRAENWTVQRLLHPAVEEQLSYGKITDIGAGTGLFLDLFPQAAGITTCIDPSKNMLERLHHKHPTAKCVLGDHTTLKRWPANPLVVSLFSSLCHAPKDEVPDAVAVSVAEGGKFFGMFAAPGEHHSLILEHARMDIDLHTWTYEDLCQLAKHCRASNFHIIGVNRFLILWMEGVHRG